MNLNFGILKKSGRNFARRGKFTIRGIEIDTPVFMPVGTYGAVKSVSPNEIYQLGYNLILANTYHLYLRPGFELIERIGGLRRFTSFDRCFLTDSGGFQVFSLAKLREINEDGVSFRSHIDGSLHFFTPELSIRVQNALGADIIMAFDECPAGGAEYEYVRKSIELTFNWAKRSIEAHRKRDVQALFGIFQGGIYSDLREKSLEQITSLPFDGFAIRLKVAAISGLFFASPIVLWQLWRFISPGLHTKERRYGLAFVLSALVLFGFGAAVAYLVFPHALHFFESAAGAHVHAIYTPQNYLNFLMLLMIAFGVSFLFPLVLIVLELVGAVSPTALRKRRRYAWLGIIVVVAVFIPSNDPYSLTAMTVPLLVFYELAILVGRILLRGSPKVARQET